LIITTIPERDWSEEIWKEANSIVLEEIIDTRIKNYQVLFILCNLFWKKINWNPVLTINNKYISTKLKNPKNSINMN
jgi:hypothetical protein